MKTPTIRISRYRWATDKDEEYLRAIGADGAVVYLIENVDCEAQHDHDPLCHRHEMHQKFALNRTFRTNHEIVWSWDGDRDAPTLEPSFLCGWSSLANVHLYLRKGRIRLLPDSTVTLAP